MKKISKFPELLFFFGYALIIFSDMFNDVEWLSGSLLFVDILSISVLLLSFFFGVYADKKKMSLLAVVGMVAFTALVCATALISDNRTLIKLPFLFIAFMNMNFNNFVKFDLKARAFLLLTLMVLTLFGLNGETVLEYRNGFMRNSFGMGHPNAVAFELSILCADVLYIFSKKKEKSLFPIIFSIMVILFNVLFLGSRTNMVLVVILNILYLIKNKKVLHSVSIRELSQNMFFICLCLSIGGIFLYKTGLPIMEDIDALMSRRLFFESLVFDRYGISLFGHKLTQGVLLDNAYINLLLRCGALLTVFMGFLYGRSIKRLISKNQMLLVLFLVAFMIYGLSETAMYSPGKNPFIVLLVFAFVGINDGYGFNSPIQTKRARLK